MHAYINAYKLVDCIQLFHNYIALYSQYVFCVSHSMTSSSNIKNKDTQKELTYSWRMSIINISLQK